MADNIGGPLGGGQWSYRATVGLGQVVSATARRFHGKH